MRIVPFRHGAGGFCTTAATGEDGGRNRGHGGNVNRIGLSRPRFWRRNPNNSSRNFSPSLRMVKDIVSRSPQVNEVRKESCSCLEPGSAPSIVVDNSNDLLVIRQRTITEDTLMASSPYSIESINPTTPTGGSPSSSLPSPSHQKVFFNEKASEDHEQGVDRYPDEQDRDNVSQLNNAIRSNNDLTMSNITLLFDHNNEKVSSTPMLTFVPAVVVSPPSNQLKYKSDKSAKHSTVRNASVPDVVVEDENNININGTIGNEIPSANTVNDDQILRATGVAQMIRPSDCLYAFDLSCYSSDSSNGSYGIEIAPIDKIKELLLSNFGLEWSDIHKDLFGIENRLVGYQQEDEDEDDDEQREEEEENSTDDEREGHPPYGTLSFSNRSFDLSTIIEECEEDLHHTFVGVNDTSMDMEFELTSNYSNGLVGENTSLCGSSNCSDETSTIGTSDHDGMFRVSFMPSTEYIKMVKSYNSKPATTAQVSDTEQIDLNAEQAEEPFIGLGILVTPPRSEHRATSKCQRRNHFWLLSYHRFQFVIFLGIFAVAVVASNSEQTIDQIMLKSQVILGHRMKSVKTVNIQKKPPESYSWDFKNSLAGAWLAILKQA